MDIRSFFSPKVTKSAPKTSQESSLDSKRKRVQRIDSSDDEDFENEKKSSKAQTNKKPATATKSPKSTKDEKSNLKAVNPDVFFGASKSKNSKAPTTTAKKATNDDLDVVLREMDDDFESEAVSKPPPKKVKLDSLSKEAPKKTSKGVSLAKKLSSKKRSYEIEVEAPTKIKKTPKKSLDTEDDDEVPGTPQADYDEMKKKHQNAYKQFLARGGARNPGSKEVPEIVPGCFDKLVFVLTGVYDALEREDMTDIIKKCGGKITTSLSKNTTYIVVGDQPGESKLKKAETLGTKQLDEDSFLELLREKSKSYSKTPIKIAAKDTPLKSKSHKVTTNGELKEDSQKERKFDSFKKESNPKTSSPSPKKIKVEETSVNPPATKVPKKEVNVKTEPTVSSHQKRESISQSQLWVDKYKPLNLKNIIGQQGDRSNMRKLLEWLKNWSKYNGVGPNKQKPPPRPSPWATAGDSGGWAKCALLSGPPGVGKTTTASLVCKELGLDIMELNASDGRSKKTLDSNVKEALSSMSLSKTSKQRVLLMDEVDGMAGNEDRGGIAHLILLLKTSKIPVICMCNDRNHEKIRSLANHCFDLRFQRPKVEQIKAAMMSICFKEKIKMSPDAMSELITGCNNDVRQVLHHLSMLKARESSSTQSLTKEEAKREAKSSQKTSIKLGPWDVCKKVFSSQEHSSMSLFDKSDLFFYDFSIGPLFVQENYLSVAPNAAKKDKKKTMELISLAANSICQGDLIEKTIRSKNAWNLLPINAIYSSVLPGEYMSGTLHGQIQFPSWLGKNSRQNKMNRILQELSAHTRLRTGACKRNMGFDYAQHLENSITGPLRRSGSQGIEESIRIMEAYALQREDLDSLIEYSSWPGKEDPMKSVETKVKSAFTRTYNKEVTTLPYAIQQSAAKKKGGPSLLDANDDQEEELESENEDDIGSDAMIKAKMSKPSTSGKKKEEGKSSARSKKSKKK